MGHNSAEYLHTVSEALRLAFADAQVYIHKRIPAVQSLT